MPSPFALVCGREYDVGEGTGLRSGLRTRVGSGLNARVGSGFQVKMFKKKSYVEI